MSTLPRGQWANRRKGDKAYECRAYLDKQGQCALRRTDNHTEHVTRAGVVFVVDGQPVEPRAV